MSPATGAVRGADPVRDGLVLIPGATRLLVAGGRDRLRFLHAVTTQDLSGLAPGGGAYGALTDDRGHPIADFHLFVLPDVVLLEVAASRADRLRAALERMIVADDVVLAFAEGTIVSVEAGDPERVAEVVRRPAEHLSDVEPGVSWSREAAPDPRESDGDPGALAALPLAMDVVARRSQWGGYGAFQIVATEDATRPGSENAGATLDALEIESGRAGDAELSEARVLSELGLAGAVSYTKGCYPGQEILNRVRARGELKRRLTGIELGVPAGGRLAGAALEFPEARPDGRAAGRITRAVDGHALAFVGREFWKPGTSLVIRSPDGEGLPARVAALPFVARRADGRVPPPFVRAELA